MKSALFLILAFVVCREPSALAQMHGVKMIVNGRVIGHVAAQGVGADVQVKVNGVPVIVQAVPLKQMPSPPSRIALGGAPRKIAKPKKPPMLDTVSAISGDRIRGKLVGITPDGIASITADHFAGPVLMRRSNIRQITFARNQPKNMHSLDLVELTNKDVIVGTIVSISPRMVAIKSVDAGDISIRRNIIKSITFSNASPVEIISQFEYGIIEPWEAAHGNWAIENKMLVVKGVSKNLGSTIVAPWDYSQSFTMTIDMSSTQYVNCQLIFFTSDKKSNLRRNQNDSVIMRLSSYYFNITSRQGGRYQQLGNGRLGLGMVRRGGGGDLLCTISFDVETRSMTIWSGHKKMGSVIIPSGLVKGRYVVFAGDVRQRIRRLDIRRGVSTPDRVAEVKPILDHQIFFKNGDIVAADALMLLKGNQTLTATLNFGEVSIARDAIARIVFGSKNQEEPRRLIGDVLVETSQSRFTVQMTALTDKALIGKSNAFGGIIIHRSAIRRVKFHIYK